MSEGRRLVTTGMSGLDLLLGGGLALVERGPAAMESATILVRGGPGAGKTIFGMQLATCLAHIVNTPIVYACIELLPEELRLQQQGLLGEGAPQVHVPREGAWEAAREQILPRDALASVLALGEPGTPAATVLADSLIPLLERAAQHAGYPPRVLVIDSLSDGYGLGSQVPREVADAIMKLAVERGLALVLLEETTGGAASWWSFAADTVIELAPPEEDQPYERRLFVRKHRFAPTVGTLSRFSIVEDRGVLVFPAPVAYRTSWARRSKVEGERRRWGASDFDRHGAEALTLRAGHAVLFVDQPRGWARGLLWDLGARDERGAEAGGDDVWLASGPTAVPELLRARSVVRELSPGLSAERWLAELVSATEARVVRRVVVWVADNDLHARFGWAAARELLATALEVLRARAVPVFLFAVGDVFADLADFVVTRQSEDSAWVFDAAIGRSISARMR